MNRKAGLFALTIAFAAPSASAQLLTYDVAGTFTDGRTLSGSFTVDPTKVNAAQYSGVNVAVSGIGYLPNVVSAGFGPPGVGTGPFMISGFLLGGNFSSTLQLGFTGDHAGFQLMSIVNGPLLTPTTFYMNNGTTTYLSSGTISRAGGAVPEPATWALMLLGFAAAGFSLRRSRRMLPASHQDAERSLAADHGARA